jgi:RNase P/RNase MRP subunit p29
MTDYNYKIGDTVKIIKPKTHICLGNVGKILKINKNTLIINGDEINCKNASVTINKKYVEFQERIPLTVGGNIDTFLKSFSNSKSTKKRGLDYYIKKAFPLKDFGEFVLFHFIMPSKIGRWRLWNKKR